MYYRIKMAITSNFDKSSVIDIQELSACRKKVIVTIIIIIIILV